MTNMTSIPGRLSMMKMIVLSMLGLVACTKEGAGDQQNVKPVDTSSLTGKVMCGYQGWFRTPGDNQDLGWRHYRNPRTGEFRPGDAGIDYWPDMVELSPQERFDTPFRHADGSVAQVFSSVVPETVLRHFRWMNEYGIDGVFLQRFGVEVTSRTGRADNATGRACDVVLDNCRAGAKAHGRTYAVMYDLSGMSAGRIAALREDWRHLVENKGILKDERYQRHAGRPVVALWGIGFTGRDYGPREVADLVNFIKGDGEVTIMLGTASGWRTGERDAAPFEQWKEVYQAAGVISPWTVGRFRDEGGAREYARGRAKADLLWCEEHGKDFMPVVFPGFSWANLKEGTDDSPDAFIDRKGGRFLWSQYDAQVREAGAKMIYQAMFDELDEGTQIFKTTNHPPVGESRFRPYDGLPSDHYLWLVGEATRRVRGGHPFTPELPERAQPEP